MKLRFPFFLLIETTISLSSWLVEKSYDGWLSFAAIISIIVSPSYVVCSLSGLRGDVAMMDPFLVSAGKAGFNLNWSKSLGYQLKYLNDIKSIYVFRRGKI